MLFKNECGVFTSVRQGLQNCGVVVKKIRCESRSSQV